MLTRQAIYYVNWISQNSIRVNILKPREYLSKNHKCYQSATVENWRSQKEEQLLKIQTLSVLFFSAHNWTLLLNVWRQQPFYILLMVIHVACYWSLVFDLQEEDVIQDRFIVHGDHYRAVREGLAKTVITGNIQDIVTAITVSVHCIFSFSIGPFIFVIVGYYGLYQLQTFRNDTDILELVGTHFW